MKDPNILDDHLFETAKPSNEEITKRVIEPDLYTKIISVYSWETASYYQKEFRNKGLNVVFEERSTPNFVRIDVKAANEHAEQAKEVLTTIKSSKNLFGNSTGGAQTTTIEFFVFILFMVFMLFSMWS